MSSNPVVGTWLSELKRGNAQAAQQLWDCYFDKLVRVARSRLPDRFRRSADEEDVALSALRTFFRRAGAGQFSCVCSGDELWPLLVRITARKAWKLLEHEGRQKRGGGQVLGESALGASGSEDEERGIEQVVGREPSPDFVVQVADTCDDLLRALPDEMLRQVARLALDGYTLEEIAVRLEFSVATAGRKLTRVRSLWAARVQA